MVHLNYKARFLFRVKSKCEMLKIHHVALTEIQNKTCKQRKTGDQRRCTQEEREQEYTIRSEHCWWGTRHRWKHTGSKTKTYAFITQTQPQNYWLETKTSKSMKFSSHSSEVIFTTLDLWWNEGRSDMFALTEMLNIRTIVISIYFLKKSRICSDAGRKKLYFHIMSTIIHHSFTFILIFTSYNWSWTCCITCHSDTSSFHFFFSFVALFVLLASLAFPQRGTPFLGRTPVHQCIALHQQLMR